MKEKRVWNRFLLTGTTTSICKQILVVVLTFLSVGFVQAGDNSLLLNYNFASATGDSVADISGNGYNAALMNAASVRSIGRFGILDLGSSNGYLNLTTKAGRLIKTLTDFTISTYVYVSSSTSLTTAGNFVWTFANSDNMTSTANGNMFFSAISNRYAISKTNWVGETSVSQAVALTKGAWQHISYTQSGTTGSLYVNGTKVKTATVSVKPSDLGSTTSNYIGKSCYSGDAYLKNSLLTDFRIYNRALSASEVTSASSNRAALDSALILTMLEDAKSALIIPKPDSVVSNLTLASSVSDGVVVSWTSSNSSIVSQNGVVVRPVYGSNVAKVVLTATLTKNGISVRKEFNLSVIPFMYDDLASVRTDSASLSLSGNLNLLRMNLTLPSAGNEGSSISWQSDFSSVLSATGVIVNRPVHGSGNKVVTLTATIQKGNSSVKKTFAVTVAEDEGYTGYLFAYFTGNDITQEAIRFALSSDGYVFNALNNNSPVISSSTISSTGGVRDPHILRGENNDYYMVATDMVSANGWNSNRAMILMKSTDLINWTSVVINIPTTYTQYAAADRIWAPQTIYDPVAGKYMVYFSMRLGSSDYDKIYYAYANSSFTALESAPKLLFDNAGLATIDGDIVYKDGLYHMFFKTEGNGNGIKKASSSSLTSGYVLLDKYLQSTTNAVEGGCVFRRYNSDNWILMYDMYTSGAYQFTTSTDLINYSVVSNTISFDFTPRHGTIIPVTATEIQALNKKWGTAASVDENKQYNLTIYPVPTKNVLNLAGNTESVKSYSVFDVTGRCILVDKAFLPTNPIDISELKTGVYFLRMKDAESNVITKRFVVER